MYHIKEFHTKKQMKELQPICEAFAAVAKKNLNWKHWLGAVGGLVQNGIADCLVLYHDQKICGALIWSYFPDLVSGELCATEALWYVKPKNRGDKGTLLLLDMMEKKAKDKGVKTLSMVSMACLRDNALGAFYERRGFKKAETVYSKVL